MSAILELTPEAASAQSRWHCDRESMKGLLGTYHRQKGSSCRSCNRSHQPDTCLNAAEMLDAFHHMCQAKENDEQMNATMFLIMQHMILRHHCKYLWTSITFTAPVRPMPSLRVCVIVTRGVKEVLLPILDLRVGHHQSDVPQHHLWLLGPPFGRHPGAGGSLIRSGLAAACGRCAEVDTRRL
jgi:hypothetical protein